jgi:glyoxylase-like metal-dependent hydrolase (beta-lactamase superfamily II)
MHGPAEVAAGVWGLGSGLVNWYLVEDEGGLVAVDAGLPGFAARLEDDLRRIGRTPRDVTAVVLTHSESDHTGVAPQLRDAGARVLIHADDDATLRKPGPKGGDASVPHALASLRHAAARKVIGHIIRNGGMKPAKIEGAETFADGDVLDVPGRPRVVHTPGHTRGHCVLLFEGKGVLFVGDAMCAHEIISPDRRPALMPSYVNVDTAQAVASLARLEPLEAGVVLFGHGEPWRDGPAAAVASARGKAAA